MHWRQTSLYQWLQHREGASATNPIEVLDDDDDDDTVDAATTRLQSTDSNSLIVIDDESADDTLIDTAMRAQGNNRQIESAFAADTPPERIEYHWPMRLPYWDYNRNPWNVAFIDMDLGRCVCTRDCLPLGCDNARSAIFCDDSNCKAVDCGNRLRDWHTLVLLPCIKGLGVMTTAGIPRGTVLGEYCGSITPESKLTVKQIGGGFVVEFRSGCTYGDRAYIDAKPGGSLCRFVNHSCSPNSAIEERASRTVRKMVIVANRQIRDGEEITVRYSERVPFFCLCGEPNCQSRRRRRPRNTYFDVE